MKFVDKKFDEKIKKAQKMKMPESMRKALANLKK